MSAEFWSEILNGRDLLQKLGVQVRTKFYSRQLHISPPKRPDRPWSPPSTVCLSLPPGIQETGRDINHSPSTTAEVKNEWRYTSTPPICLQILDTEGVTWIDLAQDIVVAAFWCRIPLWFRLMGGLQAKSMTSQRNRATHKMADMRWYGNVMTTTRWRLYVTMETLWQQQDGGYALLWKRYPNIQIT